MQNGTKDVGFGQSSDRNTNKRVAIKKTVLAILLQEVSNRPIWGNTLYFMKYEGSRRMQTNKKMRLKKEKKLNVFEAYLNRAKSWKNTSCN